MSSVNAKNNYFVNVDSYFRDNSIYPNPTDFGINFSTFQGTGTYVQGEPLNVDSFYEPASIDPDYLNSNLSFLNATVCKVSSQIPIGNAKEYYISGIYDYTQDFVISSGTGVIYYQTGTSLTGGAITNEVSMKVPFFALAFQYLDTEEVSISYIITVRPSNPSIVNNYTSNATFVQSSNKNFYFLFDFSLREFDFVVSQYGVDFYIAKVSNPTIDPNLSGLMENVGKVCLCLVYLDYFGDIGYVNGHTYGYHIFSSNYDLIPTQSNGSFSLVSDTADNIYISGNVNPFRGVPKLANPIISYVSGNITRAHEQVSNVFFENSTGTVMISLNEQAYKQATYPYTYGPFLMIFTLDDPNYPYLQNTLIAPNDPTVNFVANSVFFTGASGGPTDNLFGFISLLDSNQNLVNPVGNPIYLINRDTFACTAVATVPTIGAASVAQANVGGFCFIFNISIANVVTVYLFNTVTFALTLLNGIAIPSIYYFLSNCFTQVIGANIYLYVMQRAPAFVPSSYYSEQTLIAFVIEYNTAANTISIIESFPIQKTSEQIFSISKRASETFLYVNGTNDSINIYNITNPFNVATLHPLNINNLVDALVYPITKDGITKYYMGVSVIGGENVMQIYDVTDNSNIQPLGPIVNGRTTVNYTTNVSQFSFRDGYVWGVLYGNLPYDAIHFAKNPACYFDEVISSTQYNLNISNTLQSPSGATRISTWTSYDGYSYTSFISQTEMQICEMTYIKFAGFIQTFPVSIPTTINDMKTILDTTNIYTGFRFFVVCCVGYVFLYAMDQQFQNLDLIGYYSGGVSFLESCVYTVDNLIYCLVTTSNCDLLKFSIDIDNGLTLVNSVSVAPGYIPGLIPTWFNPALNKYYVGVSTTINFTAAQDTYYLYEVTAPTQVDFVDSSLSYPGAFPRSAWSANDPRDGLSYAGISVNIAMAAISVTNETDVKFKPVFNDTQTINFEYLNGMSRYFYTDRPYVISNRYGGTGSLGDYLSCFDLSNWAYGVQVFEGVSVAGTGATISSPVFCLDMSIFTTLDSRTTLVCLNSDGNTYLYDLTNPYYAGQYQTLTALNTFTTIPPSFGDSFIYKLDNEGNDIWLNTIRNNNTGSGINGQMINTTNVRLTSDNLNIFIAGCYSDVMQTYSPNSTTPQNQLSYIGEKNNSFIGKCSSIDGTWEFVVPINGINKDFIQGIEYTSKDNAVTVVGYSTSPNIVVYEKQVAGSLENPIIPQFNIVQASSNSNSFVVKFSFDGSYMWSSKIYSNESLRSVEMLNISYDQDNSSEIVVTGISNSQIIKCIDSTGENTQELLSYIASLDNVVQNVLISYYFDLEGNYLRSNNIVLPIFTYGSIKNTADYSATNATYQAVAIDYKANTETTWFNKDGTKAEIKVGPINKTISYISSYLVDSRYTDTNGNKYSSIKLVEPPSYPFTGGFMTNYYMYIHDSSLNTNVVNQNFSIRTNFVQPVEDYRVILNNSIDVSKLYRYNAPVNGLTGTDQYYVVNIGTNPLFGMTQYEVTSPTEMILLLPFINLVEGVEYFLTYPKDGVIKNLPIESFLKTPFGYTYITVSSTADFVTSPLPNFFPYVYITSFNINVFYNLQFFPASINTAVYFTISLNSLTIPNRPMRQGNSQYSQYLTEMPYIYCAIYCVNSQDKTDDEIVNIVYDNNPNRENVGIFQLNTMDVGGESNYVTYSSAMTPRIKFLPNYNTLRCKLFDRYGNVILFDNTPYKISDAKYEGSVVPPELMNVSIQFNLFKI